MKALPLCSLACLGQVTAPQTSPLASKEQLRITEASAVQYLEIFDLNLEAGLDSQLCICIYEFNKDRIVESANPELISAGFKCRYQPTFFPMLKPRSLVSFLCRAVWRLNK